MRRRELFQRVICPFRKIIGSGDVKAGMAVLGRVRRQGDHRRFSVASNEVGCTRVERLDLSGTRVGDLRSAQHDFRSVSQGTQQPLHLILAPDERPDPDEGVGSGLVDGTEYFREECVGTRPWAIDRIRDDAHFDTRAAQRRRDRGGPQPETRVSRSYPVHRHQHDGSCGPIRVRIGRMDSRLRGNNGERAVDVIPAKAGIHGFSDQRSSKTRKPNTDACGPSGMFESRDPAGDAVRFGPIVYLEFPWERYEVTGILRRPIGGGLVKPRGVVELAGVSVPDGDVIGFVVPHLRPPESAS